nr:hypothetical protein HK105_007543 [Polyrhizophydium stewartii]
MFGIDYWVDFAHDNLFATDFKKLSSSFDILDNHLTLRSFMVGYSATLADYAVWGALKANAIFNKQLKGGKYEGQHLVRWYNFVGSLDPVKDSLKALEAAKEAAKDRRDQGSMEIDLIDAADGKVVTRFPPEPSGYLHVGHAKALLLNEYFARRYKGTLIVRFDDTNPSNEKSEFEQSIMEDIGMLGVSSDRVTHTSDYFDQIYDEAIRIIKLGKAYVDDTDQDTMRAERFDGIESKCRNLSVEENLKRFEEMKNGTEFGLKCCLRAKIDMQDKNKAMRDPVIYRCNLTPHHYTGTKYKIYPTYDFACPIVDSLEGVTHALRSIEYRDRNAQYAWFLKTLNLRWVHVWDYSRVNFVYTLMSKRKLKWFVEEGRVSGWDDPRFPTVRGILRRGMTIQALRQYILSQGASQRDLMLEWDKVWATNKKFIDPVAPRHVAIAKAGAVKVKIVGEPVAPHTKEVAKHKKNPDVGVKLTTYSSELLLEQDDAKEMEQGEEITLMDWGNAIAKSIHRNAAGAVDAIELTLNLAGDVKKTKKKVTWLSSLATKSVEPKLVHLTLIDYDYLITKKKLEEEDELTDFLAPVTEFRTDAFGDANLRLLARGDIIQLERKGYYICDRAFDAAHPAEPIHLIYIPDGKVASLASKAGDAAAPTATAAAAPPAAKSLAKSATAALPASPAAGKVSSMYHLEPVYGAAQQPLDVSKASKMYALDPVYGPQEPLVTPEASKPPAAKAVPSEPQAGAGAAAAAAAAVPLADSGKKKKGSQAVAPAQEASIISKLDIVVGKVLDVKKHPDADSLYVEQIDIGESAPREVVSGLVKFMSEDEIKGKTILVLKNLKPVAMRGIKSYAMVLCASNAEHDKVEFLVPPPGSVPGDRVYFEGHEGEPEPQLNPKKKVWETVQPEFTTRDDLVAVWRDVPFRTDKGLVKAATLAKATVK